MSQAHARSLVGLDKEQQDYFFQLIKNEDISVRKLEALLTEKKTQEAKKKSDSFIKDEEDKLKNYSV